MSDSVARFGGSPFTRPLEFSAVESQPLPLVDAVEAAAKALYEADGGATWDGEHEARRNGYRLTAKVVLDAAGPAFGPVYVIDIT